eukprot:363423-Chlamydomonas_euryale.AAC.7
MELLDFPLILPRPTHAVCSAGEPGLVQVADRPAGASPGSLCQPRVCSAAHTCAAAARSEQPGIGASSPRCHMGSRLG